MSTARTPRRRRLLVLATYPRTAAATRFRTCAHFPALARRGIDAELHPFIDDAFMARLYQPGGRATKALGLARFAARRLALLLAARRYDGVFVQREAALIGPAITEAALARGFRLPMVFDLDDAIWLQDTSGSRHPFAARLLKSPSKTNDLLGMATEVVTATEYLAQYAGGFNPRVTVVPTVVSRETWTPLPGRLDGAFASPPGAVPTIGWIGTHSTATHLDLIVPALEALARSGARFRVRLVGTTRTLPLPAGIEVESVPWREASELEDFQRIDVGIAPVRDDAWSRGKGGFKQIQYMAVGVPMVSSAVGGAVEFLRHGENALAAHTTEQWHDALRALLEDRALRGRLARSGRALVETKLCTEVQTEVLCDIIERALGDGRATTP